MALASGLEPSKVPEPRGRACAGRADGHVPLNLEGAHQEELKSRGMLCVHVAGSRPGGRAAGGAQGREMSELPVPSSPQRRRRNTRLCHLETTSYRKEGSQVCLEPWQGLCPEPA